MVNDLTKTRREKFTPAIGEVLNGDDEDYTPVPYDEDVMGPKCIDPNSWSPEEQRELKKAMLKIQEEKAKEERKNRINELESQITSLRYKSDKTKKVTTQISIVLGGLTALLTGATTADDLKMIGAGLATGILTKIGSNTIDYVTRGRKIVNYQNEIDTLYAKDHPSAMWEEQPGA